LLAERVHEDIDHLSDKIGLLMKATEAVYIL
jgi:hypothetical protein